MVKSCCDGSNIFYGRSMLLQPLTRQCVECAKEARNCLKQPEEKRGAFLTSLKKKYAKEGSPEQIKYILKTLSTLHNPIGIYPNDHVRQIYEASKKCLTQQFEIDMDKIVSDHPLPDKDDIFYEKAKLVVQALQIIIIASWALRAHIKSCTLGLALSGASIVYMQDFEKEMGKELSLVYSVLMSAMAIWSMYHHLRDHGDHGQHGQHGQHGLAPLPLLIGATTPFSSYERWHNFNEVLENERMLGEDEGCTECE